MYCSFGDIIYVNSPSIVGFHVLIASVTALAASCRRTFFFPFSFHFTLVIHFNVDTKGVLGGKEAVFYFFLHFVEATI